MNYESVYLVIIGVALGTMLGQSIMLKYKQEKLDSIHQWQKDVIDELLKISKAITEEDADV